jgi:glyoxylase-like metal-dependent hydrolase (beta-lactamase superfamily II)
MPIAVEERPPLLAGDGTIGSRPLPPAVVLVDSIEVVPVPDAVGELGELAELYPRVPAEAWEPYRSRYPDLFAGTRWRLPVTCYLLRSHGTTVLVDSGVGPPGLWDWIAEEEGGLLGAVAPDDVDLVFLTHLHIDHVGWNADAEGKPLFRRYVVHTDALSFARAFDDRPHILRCIESIVEHGLVETVVGETELAAGVVAFETPGHYPGHMSVRIEDGALLLGDAAVHPALLVEPEWEYVSDRDRERSARTRQELLPLIDGKLVVCGHYPGSGIGRMTNGLWEPLEEAA